MVRAAAVERPLLIVVDDLQWAAPSTLLLLAHLVRAGVPRTALIATVRAGESGQEPETLLGDLGTGRAMTVVRVDGLNQDEVDELVALQVGERPPADLSERLRRHTDGNPFFLGTLLAHLEEAAGLHHADGSWMTTTELDAVGVPSGVRPVISRRLALLPATARRALDVGAVVGHAFDERTLRGVLGVDVDEAVDALEEAIRVGLLREQTAGRLLFAHALVRHAVLDTLSRTRQASLHRQVGEELERQLGDDQSRIGEIARHHAAAGDLGEPATVVRTSLAAGDDALQRLSFEDAVTHYRTALDALGEWPTILTVATASSHHWAKPSTLSARQMWHSPSGGKQSRSPAWHAIPSGSKCPSQATRT